MDRNLIERLAKTEEIHNIGIKHNGSEQVFNFLEETILITEENRIKGITRSATNNICLIGETGAGKTRLSSRILKRFPIQEVSRDNFKITKIPTLYASNTGRSLNGLANAMLSQLNDPGIKLRPTLIELTAKLSQQLKSAETNLIMLDEFHEISTIGNAVVVMNWLKSLTNATLTPVMIMGTPALKSLIESNEEVKRRFRVIELEKLEFSTLDSNCPFNSFSAGLAEKFKQIMSLKSFPAFDNMADLIRLNLATNGYPGNISELYKSAAKLAIREGVNEVKLHHFRDVYNYDKCTNLQIKTLNPFTVEEDKLLTVFHNNNKKVKRS
ncbi:TniB family NTP-binding protein [Methylophaga sp.]|uniref:TniB family NTP-binding protein n=1 Tax=Methylophaga sp. TaxID=2024840 RepID=UPI003A9501A9